MILFLIYNKCVLQAFVLHYRVHNNKKITQCHVLLLLANTDTTSEGKIRANLQMEASQLHTCIPKTMQHAFKATS